MIKLGVSACLLGQNVRYDGKNKFANLEKHFDPAIYELIPICPEVEMGMSVPRPPIQIINSKQIKLVQVDDHSIDYTKQMQTWFENNKDRISDCSGFILKSKSPSCGNQSTKHINTGSKYTLSDGLFVQLLKKDYSKISFIDENQLFSKPKNTAFIQYLASQVEK